MSASTASAFYNYEGAATTFAYPRLEQRDNGLQYAYDTLATLSTITDNEGDARTYTYDPSGQ